MHFILSTIKNIIAIVIIMMIVYIALRYAPFLRDQEWNPVSSISETSDINNLNSVPETQYNQQNEPYTIEDNDLIQNIPKSQIKNVFKIIDKQEFMAVSGLRRMGYNDDYIAGQRDDHFIIYKLGSDKIKVFNTEIDMEQELIRLKQHIPLKELDAY